MHISNGIHMSVGVVVETSVVEVHITLNAASNMAVTANMLDIYAQVRYMLYGIMGNEKKWLMIK